MISAQLREALDIARDIAKHADMKAWESMMLVVNTAPDELKPIVMLLIAMQMRVSSEALIAAVHDTHPDLDYLASKLGKATGEAIERGKDIAYARG